MGAGHSANPGAKFIHRYFAFSEEPVTDAIGVSDYNVFFNTGTENFVVGETFHEQAGSRRAQKGTKEIPLAEWRKMGFDTHSVIADPLFVNPANDDYRLKPESPALKLGFVPIDVSKIGIRD